MNNTDSHWIALSTRRPAPSDWDETHGVIYADENRATKPNQWLVTEYPNTPSTRATHWCRVELQTFPKPREPTQEDKDDVTCHKWLESRSVMSRDECRTTWHVAVAHERAHLGMPAELFVKELREMLDHTMVDANVRRNLRALLDRANKG